MTIKIPEQYQGHKNLTIKTHVDGNYSYVSFSGHRNLPPKSSLAKLLSKLDRDLFGNKNTVMSFQNVNNLFVGEAKIAVLELKAGKLADKKAIENAIINSLT